MTDTKVISPEKGFTNPHLSSPEEYKRLYEQSINDPVTFFQNAAKENLVWSKPFTTTFNNQFKNAKWFEDGELNIAYNCIDRHLEHHQNKTAFIWEGDDPAESKNISYQELHEQVCRLANFMKDLGVNKGDRVCIYLPMIPEAVYSMLACAQIKDAIYDKGYLLSSISNARRFDEFNKIFMYGKAQHNFEKLETFDLLKHLVSHVGQSNSYGYRLQMSALINTDNRVHEGKSVTPGFLLAAILWPKLIEIATVEDSISTRRFFPNMDKILRDQQILTAVPRRFYTYIKDIWSLQLRLQSRIKNQPFKVLQHPRFRAAYDLLLLRIEASNSESEIGDWWTKFQSCNRQTKLEMIKRHRENSSNSKKFGLSGELG